MQMKETEEQLFSFLEDPKFIDVLINIQRVFHVIIY